AAAKHSNAGAERRERASEAVLSPIRRPQQNDPGCLHEEHAQVTVAALGHAPEDGSVAGRHLPRDEAKPRSCVERISRIISRNAWIAQRTPGVEPRKLLIRRERLNIFVWKATGFG